MHQVLLQRGCHSFIRYCASESVFAGFRRIAKLATSIAIAVAFTGIALPTSSAQAQTATLAATGSSSISDGEEKTFTLTLDELPTNRNITHATVTLIVRGDNPLLDHPSGTGYEGASFDVIVTGDNDRAVTLNRQNGAGRIQKRMSVTIPLDPTSGTAGAGQPAVITYTVRGKSVLSDQSFSLATFARSFSFRDNNSNDFELSGLAVTGSPQSFTVAASDDRVLLTYGYPGGATIPNFKTEAPASYTGLGGRLWSGGRNLLLGSGIAAHYTDGTVYQCAESSTGNCVINLGAFSGDIGRIVAGGPVHVTALGIPPTAVSAIAADDAAEGDDIDVTITLDQRLPLTASGVGRVAYAVAGRGASPIDPAADVTVASPATFSADGTGPTLTFTIAANADNLVESDETGTVTVTGITWSGGDLTGLSESADFAVSDVALPPPVAEPQDPRLIYTYENLAVIPDHLFKSEEPTNASSAGITWTEDVSLAITHNATATYSDGTTYECLSGGGCVITFASRQINNGGQVRISQPFAVGTQFLPASATEILFNGTAFGDETRVARSGSDAFGERRPRRRAVTETNAAANNANGTAAFVHQFTNPPTLSSGAGSSTCTYGIGGGATYGEDYFLRNAAGNIAAVDVPEVNPRNPEEIVTIGDVILNRRLTVISTGLDCGTTEYGIRIVPDNDIEENENIIFVLLSVQLFVDEANATSLGFISITQPDTLVLTIENDDTSSDITRITAVNTNNASPAEGDTARITLNRANDITTGVAMDYSITGPGVSDEDFTITAIDTNTELVANDGTIVTQTNACAGITDRRCGTLTIPGTSGNPVLDTEVVGFDIAFALDNLAENTEAVTVTFYSRRVGPEPAPGQPDEREGSVLFPEPAEGEPAITARSVDISVTSTDTTTLGIDSFGGDSLTETTGSNSLGLVFEMTADPGATVLGYRMTGIQAADLTSVRGTLPTVVENGTDPRSGTFTITSGSTGNFTILAAADSILEGNETITLTFFAGDPDSTRQILTAGTTNGVHPITLGDSTTATARVGWVSNTGFSTSDTVREGSHAPMRVDLGSVTVAQDTFFPITVDSAHQDDVRIELLDSTAVAESYAGRTEVRRPPPRESEIIGYVLQRRGALIPAGRSQGPVIIQTLNDDVDEVGPDTATFTVGAAQAGAPPAVGASTPRAVPPFAGSITPGATATLAINDRPAVAADAVVWSVGGTAITRDGEGNQVPPIPVAGGAGLTKVADLTLKVTGGLGDNDSVEIVYTHGDDAETVGSISWLFDDNNTPDNTDDDAVFFVDGPDENRNRKIGIPRSRFSQPEDGGHTITIGLYYTPLAAVSTEVPITISMSQVTHIRRDRVGEDLRVVGRLCDNRNRNGAADCSGVEFNVGTARLALSNVDTTASEADPSDTGGLRFQILPDAFPAGAGISATVNYTIVPEQTSARRGADADADADYFLTISATSDEAGNTDTSAQIGGDLPTGANGAGAGTITIPNANKADFVTLTVTAIADAVNDNERVVLRLDSVEFSDAGEDTDFAISRTFRIAIANQQLVTLSFRTGAETNFRVQEGNSGQTTPGAGQRNLRTNQNSPKARLIVEDVPADAGGYIHYVAVRSQVTSGSATYGGGPTGDGTGGAANSDYMLARGFSLSPTQWITQDSTIYVDRSTQMGPNSATGRFQDVFVTGSSLFNLDFWAVTEADTLDEPPETINMRFTVSIERCIARGTCDRGTDRETVGGAAVINATFTMNDQDSLVRSLVLQNASDSSADSVAEGETMDVELLLNDTVLLGGSQNFAYTITDATNAANTDNAAGFVAADLDNPALATGNLTVRSGGSLSRFETMRFTIADDAIPEGAETLRVTLAPNTYTGTSGTERSIATGAGSSYADFTIAESDGGVPDGPSASISTTGPLNLVREATVPTPFTISASNLPLAVEGDSSTTLTTFTGTITAPGANTYTTADDFIIRDAVSGGNPVSFSAETGIFEYQPRGVTNEGTVEQILYIDTSGRAGTEESFVITLTGVETCPSGIGGECGGANLTPAVTIAGSPLTVNLAAAGALEIAPATGTIVETDPASPAEFTISGAAIGNGDTVALSLGGTATFGACNVALVGGLCSGTVTPDTADYFLAVNTPHEISSDGTSITARADVAADAGITVSVIPRPDTTADPNETVILTLIDAGTDPAISATAEDITATVTLLDPGTVRLASTSNARTFAVGGVKTYAVEVAGVGVADGVANANDQPVRNRAGEDEIDVVIELDFPDNNPGFAQDGTDDNLFTGRNYNVELNEEISDDHRVSFLTGTNTIRIIVPQTSLRRSGASGGNLAGGEQFNFQITAKAAASRFDFDMTAYTARVGNAGMRRDTLNRAGEQQRLTFVAPPPVVLTNTLADNTEIAGTQGIIPADGNVNNTLTYTLTNDTGLGDISQPVVSYTLRIAPADGGAAISNEIDFITGANDADVTIVGTPFTAASGAGNENVREITIHRTAVENMVDAGNDVSLIVPLRAGVFTGADRRFTISLHNVRVVSSDVRLSNAPPPAAQSLEVFVEASTLPTATLTVTGPLEIEDGGDATLGGLDTTTFEVLLENITPGAADTAMIVAVAFDGTAASNAFSRGADTNSNYLGVSTVNEVLYLMLDDDAFTDNEETIPVEFYLVPANAAVDETIIPRIVSANFYTESDDSGSNLLRAQNLALAITGSSLPAANAATSVAAGNIINGPAADRTFTVVAEGAAPLVSLSPATVSQSIASENGSFADITVSLANLPATIGTSPTATVGSVRLTLTAESTSFATTVSDGGKTILFGSRGAIRLTLPTEIEGLVFIPNSLDDVHVQVSVPAGTTEFAIRARAPAGGDGDTMRITEVAYYNDASPPAEISDAPPPHFFPHLGSGFTIADDAVVATLSADGPTTIGTGGGVLGMTEFSLTLTNLDANDDARIPLTLSDNGTPMGDGATTASGTNYDVEILSTTGDGDPDAAIFALGVPPSVSLTAAADGTVTVNFRITSTSTANTPAALPHDFTVSIGEISVEDDDALPNPREEVVQTASLAYSIIAVGDVRSVRFVPLAPSTDLTVDEGGDTATTALRLANIPSEIPPGIGGVLVDHIDITLRATGLTFNRAPADGQSITLGNAAATLTIDSADHAFVNTDNPETVILQVNGAEASNITFTGGFVDRDMEFTLTPTNLAYYSTAESIPAGVLDGPNGADEVSFLPATFSVNVMPISASIATDQNKIVVDDVGAGEVVISMANLPVSSETTSVQVDVTFGTGANFNFDPDTEASPRLGITGVSNADGEDYTLAYSTNVLSITVPRSRLLASTGDNPEAQGEEEITVNFTALTADAAYNVVVSGSLMDGSDITFAPGTLAFTTVAAAAELAIDADDSSPSEVGNASGGFDLTLTNFPARETTITYVIPEPMDGDAIPVEDYTLVAVADGLDATNVDNQRQSTPELNPDESGDYIGSFTLLAADFATDPAVISISVVPETDGIVEGPETVTLTIPDIPGVTYTAPDPALEITIADADNAVAVVVLNGRVVDGSLNSALVREGFTYPVQVVLVQGTTTDLIETTVSGGTPAVLAGDATFTLTLADGGGTGYTADDVSLASNTITIPAGESSGQTTLTVAANDDAADPDTEERFRLFVSTSDGNVLPPNVQRGQDGDYNAAIIISATAAPTGFCEGRTPAVRNAIIAAISVSGVTDCATAEMNQTNIDAVTAALPMLQTLDLSSATLTSLQPGDFTGLTGLTSLDLSGANVNLRALPAGVFDALAGAYNDSTSSIVNGVRIIDLSGNSLTAAGLPDDVFDNLVALQTLNLGTGAAGDNDTLTSLPVGLLDNGAERSGALFNLRSLTVPSAIKGLARFAMNPVSLTQGTSKAVTVEMVDASGDPQSLPVSLFINIDADDGVSVNNRLSINGLALTPEDGIVIPAGVSSVEAIFTAAPGAAVGDREIAFSPTDVNDTFILVPDDDAGIKFRSYSKGNPSRGEVILVRNALFGLGTPSTVTATVLAPVVLDPATADAAELNNDPAAIEMTLNRATADTGTADVTFTIDTGGTNATVGVDYDLDITLPDDSPVKVGNTGDGLVGTDLDTATGRIFRLPTGGSAATFTVTPIADGFPSAEGNETVIITITEVDYNGAAAPDADTGLTVDATVTIADNTTAPQLEVIAKAPEEGDTELTEGSADGRGTFTIALSDAPEGTATVSYTLAVNDETNPAVPFDAITGVDTTGLGGEVPTTPDASPRIFTMFVADSATPVTGSLAFTAAIDADQVGESVVFTVTGVTFADDGDGTDIADPTNDTATITIVDATPDSSICTRTQQVYEAILGHLSASACGEVMNSADLTSITSLSVTDNDLTSLKAGDFAGLTGMTSLTIDGELTALPADVFDALTNLATLDLSDNDLRAVDGTVFGSATVVPALRVLNLGGNDSLAITNGSLDEVLPKLTSFTWLTPRTASFTNPPAEVPQTGSAPITVQLNGGALPVAVSIPISASATTFSVPNAVIPAGMTSIVVFIAADTVVGTSGSITLGIPTLPDVTGSVAPGVRTALIANPSGSQSLTFTTVTDPTLSLTPTGEVDTRTGRDVTFSVGLINFTENNLPGFTEVSFKLNLEGGTNVSEALSFVDAANVETSDYTVTFPAITDDLTNGDVNAGSGATAASVDVSIPAAVLTAAAGSATATFTFNFKAAAAIDDTLVISISEIVAMATSNENVDVPAALTYTVISPVESLLPAAPRVSEGRSQEITLTLTDAPAAELTIPYTVDGSSTATDPADYTIAPAGFVFAANVRTATITVTTIRDYADDDNDAGNDDDETVIINITAGLVGTYNIPANISSTVTITDGDAPPTGVTVSASPEQIDETGDTTRSTITVTLNQPALAGMIVGLSYTLTGTADLGSTCSASTDYTAAIGGTPPTPITSATSAMPGLTFAAGNPGVTAGERSKTITITACEDEVDESAGNGETVIFTILATGATNIPGHTSAVSATITIEDRAVDMEEVMMQVETVATVVATEHVSALTGLIRQRFSATSSFASPPRVPTGAVPAPSTDTNLSLPDNPENMNDMINSMGLESSAQGDSNDRYAVWIRGQRSAFEGTPEVQGLTVNYDGTSTGVGVGAEYISSGYLMGLAMNFVTTEVDLSTEGGEGSESITKYEESIVIAAPYISLKVSEGTSMWASAGYGSGTADAKLSGETKSADVSLSFLNAGADFTLIGRGFEVVTGLSGLLVRKVVDAFTFADTTIPETTIDTTQAVGEITVYRPIHIAGQTLRPYVGVSTIHDFGDIVADDDHGLGIRSGVAFSLGRISTDIEVSSELLRENRRQWTVSGGLRFASRPRGLGLSLALEGTQETLMDAEDATDDAADRTWGVGLEGGYGMSMDLLHPDGVLTPFASVDQTGNGRDMSGGVRFSVGNGLSLDLETTRQMHDDGEDASEHKAGLRGKWSF